MARDNDEALKTFSDFIQRYPDTRTIVETILYREDFTDEQRVEFIMEFIHAETIKRAGEFGEVSGGFASERLTISLAPPSSSS